MRNNKNYRATISAKGAEIAIISNGQENDYISLTDIAKYKNEAGSNSFVLSPQKWILSTKAIGLISKAGRYGGGTYAHKDIAFEFASWISPEFKLGDMNAKKLTGGEV